jgi:hypothetical protein
MLRVITFPLPSMVREPSWHEAQSIMAAISKKDFPGFILYLYLLIIHTLTVEVLGMLHPGTDIFLHLRSVSRKTFKSPNIHLIIFIDHEFKQQFTPPVSKAGNRSFGSRNSPPDVS